MSDSGSSPSPGRICDKTSKRHRKPDILLYIPPGGKRAPQNTEIHKRVAAGSVGCQPTSDRCGSNFEDANAFFIDFKKPMLIARCPANQQNDADQILSSLPKSYDEFVEVKESNGGSPLCVVEEPTPSSAFCTPVEILTTTSSSPSNVDPDDLEVQQINESFEEQLKQAQVLSNVKVKEAFYKQPNRIEHMSSDSLVSVANLPAESKRRIESESTAFCVKNLENIQEFVKNMASLSKITCAVTQPLKNIDDNLNLGRTVENVSMGKDSKSASGITWAGWGSGTNKPNSNFASVVDSNLNISRNSASSKLFTTTSTSTDPSARGSSSSPMPSTAAASSPHLNAQKSLVSAAPLSQEQLEQNDDIFFAANPELDCLSREMIDKVLLDDDFHEDGVFSASRASSIDAGSKLLSDDPQTDAKWVLKPMDYCSHGNGTYAGSTAAESDEKIRPKSSGLPNLPIFSAALRVELETKAGDFMTSSAVVEEWEDLAESDFFPIVKMSVNKLEEKLPPPIDYLKFDFKRSIEIDADEYGHVLEAYNFSPNVHTEQLHAALQQINCLQYKLEWVDDTHALIILADQNVAFQALQCYNPVIKLRPLQQASAQSKKKVKEFAAQLRPFKRKPETNAFLARRLVEGHLGKKSQVSDSVRRTERLKLESAKDSKRLVAQLKEDAWEGNI